MFLGTWLGSVDLFELDTNEGTEIVFTDGRVLDATLGYAEGPTLGTYDDKYVGSLAGFTDGNPNGKLDVSLLRAGLGLLYGLKLGIVKVI